MGQGKISSTIYPLAESHCRGVLSVKDTIDGKNVEGILKAIYPNPSPTKPKYISNPSNRTIPCHPSLFEQINVSHIRKAAKKTHGRRGRSRFDTNQWRRKKTLFKTRPATYRNDCERFSPDSYWSCGTRATRSLWCLHVGAIRQKTSCSSGRHMRCPTEKNGPHHYE